MAFRLLATPEPLLKPGMYIGMIGDWGDKFVREMPSSVIAKFPKLSAAVASFYRITWTEQILRDYYHGIMPASPSPDAAVTIDPDADIGLEPRYYTSLYQTRIGLSPDWLCYIRWPTNEYRMILEEPAYVPIVTDTDKRYIGFIDSAQSPIADPVHATFPTAMRFEFWFVRDWMPEFHAYVNSITDYVKLIMRFFVNRISILRVDEPDTIIKLLKRDIPYYPVFHYSEYVKRTTGPVLEAPC